MGKVMSFGQMMLADILPEDLYQPGMAVNKKKLSHILGEIAKRDPDSYPDIVYKLLRLGLKTGESTGGASFGIEDLRTPKEVRDFQAKIESEVKSVLDSTQDGEERQKRIREVLTRAKRKMPELAYSTGKARGNKFTLQLEGAGRGNKGSLAALHGGDVVVANSAGEAIPIPITRGYSQGQSMGQYFATSYGGRSSLVDTKLCLSGCTLVRMADGSKKRIDRISVGDWVLGADLSGRLRPVQVTNWFDNGVRECHHFSFRVMSSRSRFADMIATSDHKILSYDSDRSELPSMRPLGLAGRALSRKNRCNFTAVPSRGYEQSQEFGSVAEPTALLQGLLLGDGSMTAKNRGIHFSCADPQLIEEANVYLGEFGIQFSGDIARSYDHTLSIVDEGRRKVLFKSSSTQCGSTGRISRTRGAIDPTCRYMEETLGRKYAFEKHLPSEVWSYDRKSLSSLLAGIISTDGCFSVTKGKSELRFYLAMTSLVLVEQVRDLLEVKYGIWCSKISKFGRAEDENRKHDLWGFKIAAAISLSTLCEEIGPYILGKKRDFIERHPPRVSYSDNLGRLIAKNKGGFKPVSMVKLGMRATYDIEVDHPNHAFVLANGLVVSNSVGSSGYLSKLIQQAAHRLMVVDDEDREPIGEHRGLLVDADDEENVGAYLAQDVGPFEKNTPITPSMLSTLKKHAKNNQIMIRSPMTSSSLDGGVYARDVGIREFNRPPKRGEHVGLPAAQAIGQQVTQASLSSKHSAGAAKERGGTPGLQGFDLIDRLVNPPKEGRGLAIHAQLDGRVRNIKPAPQGGMYLTIADKEHYVSPEFTPSVKVGDDVEAGDVLTDGIPDPAQAVKHKGIGEGRRYFMQSMSRGLKEAGFPVDRRNIELLARGLIDRVQVDKPFGDFIPGSTVSYSRVERLYRPRKTARRMAVTGAVGKYLEVPTTHLSIGTRITPNTIKHLRAAGVRDVTVHDEPAPFTPQMVRGADLLQSDPDYMTRFMGSHLQKSFMDSVYTGGESDEDSTSFVPTRASGLNLGRTTLQLNKTTP